MQYHISLSRILLIVVCCWSKFFPSAHLFVCLFVITSIPIRNIFPYFTVIPNYSDICFRCIRRYLFLHLLAPAIFHHYTTMPFTIAVLSTNTYTHTHKHPQKHFCFSFCSNIYPTFSFAPLSYSNSLLITFIDWIKCNFFN